MDDILMMNQCRADKAWLIRLDKGKISAGKAFIWGEQHRYI